MGAAISDVLAKRRTRVAILAYALGLTEPPHPGVEHEYRGHGLPWYIGVPECSSVT
jgi:hypothetical protein